MNDMDDKRPSFASGGEPTGMEGSSTSRSFRHNLPAATLLISRQGAASVGGSAYGDKVSQHILKRNPATQLGSPTLLGWTSKKVNSHQTERVLNGGAGHGTRRHTVSRRLPVGKIQAGCCTAARLAIPDTETAEYAGVANNTGIRPRESTEQTFSYRHHNSIRRSEEFCESQSSGLLP